MRVGLLTGLPPPAAALRFGGSSAALPAALDHHRGRAGPGPLPPHWWAGPVAGGLCRSQRCCPCSTVRRVRSPAMCQVRSVLLTPHCRVQGGAARANLQPRPAGAVCIRCGVPAACMRLCSRANRCRWVAALLRLKRCLPTAPPAAPPLQATPRRCCRAPTPPSLKRARARRRRREWRMLRCAALGRQQSEPAAVHAASCVDRPLPCPPSLQVWHVLW